MTHDNRYILKTKLLKTKIEAQSAGFKLLHDLHLVDKSDKIVDKVNLIQDKAGFATEIILVKR